MRRQRMAFALIAVAGLTVALTAFRGPSAAIEPMSQPAPAAAQPTAKADGAEVGIKKITSEYEKAFNAGDAKAAAALFTAEGEYVGDDDEVITGRAEIEKSLADFFKANPKATAEVEVVKVRAIGRGTAAVEGVVRLTLPGDDPVIESRYTALHVLEDGKWYAASVREWVPDPATAVTPKQLEWMIGEWTAKGDAGEVKLTFAWDENKVFINGKYTISKDSKPISSGTQVFGVNPSGGLRVWTFDGSGMTNEGLWVRDGTRWLNEATGVLPDGTEITSLNVIIPLGPDAFTWQTTDRAADGVPLPALPPVKVTRVKK